MPSVYSLGNNYIKSEKDIPGEFRKHLSDDTNIEVQSDFIPGIRGKIDSIESEIQNRFSDSSCFYFGHGTPGGPETIDSIFKTGLKVKDSEEARFYMNTLRGLDSTSVLLGMGSDSLFKEREDLLNDWPHKDSEDVVILSLPYKYILRRDHVLPGSDYYENFYYGSDKKGYYLRPEFILGVYNSKTKAFTNNENYYQSLSEEERKRIDSELSKRFIISFAESSALPPNEVDGLPLSDKDKELCTLMWYKEKLKELKKLEELEKEKAESPGSMYELGDFDFGAWDDEEEDKGPKII
jgi:hypothetical protein